MIMWPLVNIISLQGALVILEEGEDKGIIRIVDKIQGSKSTIHKVTYHQQAEDSDPGHVMAVSQAQRAGVKLVPGRESQITSQVPCPDLKDHTIENLYTIITTIADQEHYQETTESAQVVIERYQEKDRVVAASEEYLRHQASEEFLSSEKAKKALTATSGLDPYRNSLSSPRQFSQCRCLPIQYGGQMASVPHLRICSRINRILVPLKLI